MIPEQLIKARIEYWDEMFRESKLSQDRMASKWVSDELRYLLTQLNKE